MRHVLTRGLVPALVVALTSWWAASATSAHAQACCVGASGLTPGWLGNHERALVGGQVRLSHALGQYPVSGGFFQALPARDEKVETSLFASYRFVPRGQASLVAPWVVTHRRSAGQSETRAGLADATLSARYELIRVGESRIPGLALLGGVTAPTGRPVDRSASALASDATGLGAWEVSVGGSVEQAFGRFVAHGTALMGWRAARDVSGLSSQLGLRGLFLLAAGYVLDGEITVLGSLTHASDGEATTAGQITPGSGSRTTQAAVLMLVPISDVWRMRTSVFADVVPLGENRQAAAGTTIGLMRTWL